MEHYGEPHLAPVGAQVWVRQANSKEFHHAIITGELSQADGDFVEVTWSSTGGTLWVPRDPARFDSTGFQRRTRKRPTTFEISFPEPKAKRRAPASKPTKTPKTKESKRSKANQHDVATEDSAEAIAPAVEEDPTQDETPSAPEPQQTVVPEELAAPAKPEPYKAPIMSRKADMCTFSDESDSDSSSSANSPSPTKAPLRSRKAVEEDEMVSINNTQHAMVAESKRIISHYDTSDTPI